MPSKDEKFLEEVRWAEVRIKRVKVTRIHCGPSVAPLLFSQPYKYIQRMLDEAARWSGGCDEAESNGGIGGSGACTHLSTQSSVVFFFKHLGKKRLMTLNWQLFSSSGSITLIKQSFFFPPYSQHVCLLP